MRMLIHALILTMTIYFSASANAGDAAEDAFISARVISDAAAKLSAKEMDYERGEYNILRKAGFADAEIREFMRPILEKAGLSEYNIIKYFNLFDPNYYGGEKRKIENQEKMVESLLN